jgi:hypothetical protein
VSAEQQLEPCRNVWSDSQVGNRVAPNEVSHLWVLAKMLTTLKSEPDLLFHFMKYVIAASHQKIKRRFRMSHSKEYWQCFSSVKPEDIPFRAVQAASKRKRLQIELENDYRFLITLGEGKIVSNYEVKYPNIANVLKELLNLKDSDGTSPDKKGFCATTFELFNDKTWKEYHFLFMALMDQYKKFVNEIDSDAKSRNPFGGKLGSIVETGHALLTMVKGRGFYLYLSTIASKLSKHLSEGSGIDSEAHNPEEHDSGKRDSKEHDSEEHDSEERDAEEGTTLWDPVEVDTMTTALWKPFKSWVMLMLVQLDAADALCAFAKQVELSEAEIEVRIVYPPLVSDETIPLEVLLTQTNYIPEAPITDPKTNAKLLDFIKTANTLKRQTKLVSDFKEKWDPMRASEAKSLIQQVLDESKKEHEDSKQRNASGVDPNKMISELCSQIIDLLSRPTQDAGADILALFTDLEIEMKERQARYNLPFMEKATFKGALHCEAGLASILDKTTRDNIRARIDTLKQAGGKKEDEQLYRSLLQLLEDTKVGFFPVRLVPTINPCSIHDDRTSRESLGYQNVAAQCAVVFLLIYRWMETPPPPALSHQVFTIPSRTAPYQNGPQNCGWMA